MSQSKLSINIEYVDQSAATEPLERLTSAIFKVSVERDTITHVWDRIDKKERPHIFVPVLPIAEWIVENWWCLLNEPCRSQHVPIGPSVKWNLPWVKRHNLRSADSSLSLPNLYLYNDGKYICMQWLLDCETSRPNMPTDFIEYGIYYLSRSEAIESLRSIVLSVLDRIDQYSSARIDELKRHWSAIESSSKEESDFCVVAGRMGLNPYDLNETTEEIARAIMEIESDPDIPYVRDLTEATPPDAITDQWAWVRNANNELDLNCMPINVREDISLPDRGEYQKSYSYGHMLARAFRGKLNIPETAAIEDILQTARQLVGRPMNYVSRNHVSQHVIRGIVGWSNEEVVMAGPDIGLANNRFFQARALFHSICSCDVSQRLLTKAFTWEQGAGRGFAAEFLAPQPALVRRVKVQPDQELVETLASEYRVNVMVIANQLKNAGFDVVSE
jgi:hypothetical protein